MAMKPLARNWSWAVEASFRALEARLCFSELGSRLERAAGASSGAGVMVGVPALLVPGCLKIPKLLTLPLVLDHHVRYRS